MIAIISDNNIDIIGILEKSIPQGDIRERQAIEMKLQKMFGKLLLFCCNLQTSVSALCIEFCFDFSMSGSASIDYTTVEQ